MSCRVGTAGVAGIKVGAADVAKVVRDGVTLWERGGGTGPWNSGVWRDDSRAGVLHYDGISGSSSFYGAARTWWGDEYVSLAYGDGVWELSSERAGTEEISAPKTSDELNFSEILDFPPLRWSET